MCELVIFITKKKNFRLFAANSADRVNALMKIFYEKY